MNVTVPNFRVVAVAGSRSNTARVARNQPAGSWAIRKLARIPGRPLIRRNKRTWLTPYGRDVRAAVRGGGMKAMVKRVSGRPARGNVVEAGFPGHMRLDGGHRSR